MVRAAVIFGGTGFIGRHMAVHLLEQGIVDKIIAADIKDLDYSVCTDRMKAMFDTDQWDFLFCDVRHSIKIDPSEEITLIFNLAAIHREPGHEPHEYYETNLPGAENVCAWAERVNCNTIVFTSSIAPYGPTEDPKDESSVPTPTTAYGGSKLVAEKIHQIWQGKEPRVRHLVIIRPGVVFGPGEGGNVSRLIKAVRRRYFVYTGNKGTRKSGSYVKELCSAITWTLERPEDESEFILFNMSMLPSPTVEDYVLSIARVSGRAAMVPQLPIWIVIIASYVIDPIFRGLRISDAFNPVRVRKLTRSNNIEPNYLKDHEYEFRYTLDDSFRDWCNEMPTEWD